MTPRKNKPKNYSLSSIVKVIILWIIPFISFIFLLPATLVALTDKAPKAKTTEGRFINSEIWIFEIRICNESQNPINWEYGIDSHTTRLRFIDSAWKNIPIQVNYPTISTAEKPECTTLTWSIQGDFYWTGKFYTECSWKITSWCSLDWKDPWKITYRKKFEHIIVDASAQSYDDTKNWERYDSINPKILDKILWNTLFTQAPWREVRIRDGLYQNPQKRTIICWNLTEEEKFFYKKIIHENFPQYINEPLFCSREELLTPLDDDLRAFLYYIGDCDEQTEKRWRICTPTSSLYTRKIHENNPDSIVIFFPAITEELKIK